MRKSIYLAAVAAIALTACSNNDNEIFDQSAAERLEQYKKEYADVLCSNGGLWAMEYFANEDEPGYVFVVKFGKDKSVTFSGNHKWIGGTYKTATSLWSMIADNGPVLSFNSYNSVFHIFSDPANITGPDAPVGDDGESDVDETGFGHEGDYEFQVMEVSEDGNTVRLLGKKRLYSAYLRRLDVNTDPEQFLTEVSEVPARFSKKFDSLVLTDTEGNKFRVNGMITGIPSIYPLDGDAVSQVVTCSGVFTQDGFRFMKPIDVKRADDSTFEVEKLYFNEAGAMSGENVEDLRCISPLENIIRPDMTWKISPDSFTGKVKSLYDAANAEILEKLSAKQKLGDLDLTYGAVQGKTVPQLVTRLGTSICRSYIEYDYAEDEFGNMVPSFDLHFSITGGNNTANKYDTQLPAYKAFKDYFCGQFTMTVNNPLIPDVITVMDKHDNTSTFILGAK